MRKGFALSTSSVRLSCETAFPFQRQACARHAKRTCPSTSIARSSCETGVPFNVNRAALPEKWLAGPERPGHEHHGIPLFPVRNAQNADPPAKPVPSLRIRHSHLVRLGRPSRHGNRFRRGGAARQGARSAQDGATWQRSEARRNPTRAKERWTITRVSPHAPNPTGKTAGPSTR